MVYPSTSRVLSQNGILLVFLPCNATQSAVLLCRGVCPGGPGSPNILLRGPCVSRAPPIIQLQNVHPCQSVIKIMKCLYCLNCPKFGQLIIRKIIRIVATRCQIFQVKMYKIRFWLGLCPRPHMGSLQLSRPLAAFKGPWLSSCNSMAFL